MKKHIITQKASILQIVPAFAVFFLLTSFTFSFTGNKEKQTVSYNMSMDSIPVEISKIVSTSCLNCHSNSGKALAMAKVNFSEWDKYDSQKQSKKARDICEQISKGHMPPKNYIKDHPEAVLSQEQIDAVCNWANQAGK